MNDDHDTADHDDQEPEESDIAAAHLSGLSDADYADDDICEGD